MSDILVSGTYCPYYDGISIYGEGKAVKEDIEYFVRDMIEKEENISVEICPGVTEIEDGFFEVFTNLSQIIVSDSVRHIGATDPEKEIYRKNKVVIRGSFDSYAEKFAKENGLLFMHADFTIGRAGEYDYRGIDTISVCFAPDGRPFIHQDNTCPGISAGNNGGGSIDIDLPDDFYKNNTPETIAAMCWGSCYDEIISSEALKTFLEKANKKNGYMIR